MPFLARPSSATSPRMAPFSLGPRNSEIPPIHLLNKLCNQSIQSQFHTSLTLCCARAKHMSLPARRPAFRHVISYAVRTKGHDFGRCSPVLSAANFQMANKPSMLVGTCDCMTTRRCTRAMRRACECPHFTTRSVALVICHRRIPRRLMPKDRPTASRQRIRRTRAAGTCKSLRRFLLLHFQPLHVIIEQLFAFYYIPSRSWFRLVI